MNRNVLAKIIVSAGDMYANDALQAICSKICKYSTSETMKWIEKAQMSPGGFDNLEDEKEYQLAMCAQRDMVQIFDSVVALGKDEALTFIKNNFFWAMGYAFKSDDGVEIRSEETAVNPELERYKNDMNHG